MSRAIVGLIGAFVLSHHGNALAGSGTIVEEGSIDFLLSNTGISTRSMSIPRFNTENGARTLDEVKIFVTGDGRYDYRIQYSGDGIEGQAEPFAGALFTFRYNGREQSESLGPEDGTVFSNNFPHIFQPTFIEIPSEQYAYTETADLGLFTTPMPGTFWNFQATAEAVVFLDIQRGPGFLWTLLDDELSLSLDIRVEYDFTVQPCSPADTSAPFGELNFNDLIGFLNAFSAMSPEADLAAPAGAFDFRDVIEYLSLFGQGCP